MHFSMTRNFFARFYILAFYSKKLHLRTHICPISLIDCTKLTRETFRFSQKELTLKEYIEERAMSIATYIIDNNATVRQTAKAFGISKSTVHKDVTDRLAQVNPSLASQAKRVLDVNKSERHIRGGLATKNKYLHMTE